MKIYRYTIYTIMLFLMCITHTYAACTEEEIKNFKKVEDEYTVKYKFDTTTKTYTLTFYIMEEGQYGYILDEILSDAKYVTSTTNSFTYSGIKSGEYNIEIVGFFEGCTVSVKTLNVNLPKYNKYSEDPLCKGIEEFVLCQPTYDKEIDYETFESRVNTYKKNKANKSETDQEKNKEENKIFQYIEDNLIQIIIVITFVILLIITLFVMIKSIRKSRRLE